MTARELQKLSPGDKVRIKRGFMNSGMLVEVLEVDPRNPPLKTAIKFKLCGEVQTWTHDRFVADHIRNAR